MVILYANAGLGVGFGHIFRLYPILHGLIKENIQVKMIVPLSEEILNNLHLKYLESVQPGIEPISIILTKAKPEIFCFDSYEQPNRLIEKVSNKKSQVICFDDHYQIKRSVHTIINPALNAMSDNYNHVSQCSLLGPDYFPLLAEFQKVRQQINIRPKVRKIIVAMGGDDTEGSLNKILKVILTEINHKTTVDVYGNSMPDIVHPKLNKLGWLHHAELIQKLSEYDIAILAGGSMLQQCACTGLPVISWPQHKRQTEHAKNWEAKGTLMLVNNTTDFKSAFKVIENIDVRKCMSKAGQKTVDGLGVNRLVAHIKKSIN